MAIPLGMLLLGLSLVHYRFVVGPGRLIPGDSIDTAFLHYVLEYGYRWLHGAFVHQSFWDAPFFYPHANSLAYSEVLLGVLPFYAIFRAVGFDPGGAYQLWFVSLSILNFAVMYAFLRRVMDMRRLPSAIGAYFFAFASPRVNQMHFGHAQLWHQFYVVLAVWSLIRFMQLRTDAPRGKAVLGLSLASAAIALQLISGFYFGWFMCLALLASLVVGLAQSRQRKALFGRARRFWPAPIVGALIFIGIAGPSVAHYSTAAAELNAQSFGADRLIMPTLGSWIYAGDNNLLYSWVRHFPRISRVSMYWERANGVGVVTGVLVLAGAFLFRRQAVFRPMLLVSVIVLAVSFTLPGGWTLWHFVYHSVPGATAVRAVSRCGVFLLFPFSIALAGCLDRIYGARGSAAVAVLGAVVLLEQFNIVQHYDFQAFQHDALSYAEQLKQECNSFLVSGAPRDAPDVGRLQVASMWAQLASGVPTMNGYSGSLPQQYPFFAGVATGLDYARMLGALTEWQKLGSPGRLRTCWLRPDPGALTESSISLAIEIVSPASPSPAQKFVRWSYVGVLGRLPRPDESAAAEAAPEEQNEGGARFILSLIQTPEGQLRAFAEKAYLAILGRDADTEGWWSSSSQLVSAHITKLDLVSSILASEEYRQTSVHVSDGPAARLAAPAEIVGQIESREFEEKLGNRAYAGLIYLYLLGRPPDAHGATAWTQHLNAGLPKAAFVEDILRSQEYQTLGGAQR